VSVAVEAPQGGEEEAQLLVFAKAAVKLLLLEKDLAQVIDHKRG